MAMAWEVISCVGGFSLNHAPCGVLINRIAQAHACVRACMPALTQTLSPTHTFSINTHTRMCTHAHTHTHTHIVTQTRWLAEQIGAVIRAGRPSTSLRGVFVSIRVQTHTQALSAVVNDVSSRPGFRSPRRTPLSPLYCAVTQVQGRKRFSSLC